MDQNTCRTQLSRLLSEESALLAQLRDQLQNEHRCLSSNDVDALESAAGARQQTLGKLLRIEDDRSQLCRLLGRTADRNGLAALLAWCDPTGSLAGAQRQSAQLAGECRAQNERNSALVTARLTRVNGMLDMLAENTPSRTYGARAARSAIGAAAPAGRMLSVNA